MKRIGYVRTSTNKQCTDRQVNELKRHVAVVMVEEGTSAAKKNRPVYQQAIATLESGDELWVLSYDRAYRNVVEGLNGLDELTRRDIRLVSVMQRFDPTTPEGPLFFTIIIAIAEWELGILHKRTVQGLRAAVKRGVRLGRPRKQKCGQKRGINKSTDERQFSHG